ncbi:Hypothetical predicted protein [Octopus vulgaris]|uniref:Uncharacterized protein n=1 Tax=Octopus vulgaris TaxID=6645 RepID=A0AA36BBL2_OCTVU|nr:Hypothetical predicted protein [Octopus vulgaris]
MFLQNMFNRLVFESKMCILVTVFVHSITIDNAVDVSAVIDADTAANSYNTVVVVAVTTIIAVGVVLANVIIAVVGVVTSHAGVCGLVLAVGIVVDVGGDGSDGVGVGVSGVLINRFFAKVKGGGNRYASLTTMPDVD